MPLPLMPWLIVSPAHQQPRQWHCLINIILPVFHPLPVQCYEMKTCRYVSSNKFSLTGPKHLGDFAYTYRFSLATPLLHYSDVIMDAMASQITGVSIVCSAICPGVDQRKHQIFAFTGLCEGNPPMTGGFPSQRGQCFHLMTSSCV